MELVLALIIFAAMILVWFVLPGTATSEEAPPAVASEGMTMTPAKA